MTILATLQRLRISCIEAGDIEGATALMRAASILECAMQDGAEIQNTLAAALGYPWYCDDPANFPDATPADGVIVGDRSVLDLAREAAGRLRKLHNAVAFAEERYRRLCPAQWKTLEAYVTWIIMNKSDKRITRDLRADGHCMRLVIEASKEAGPIPSRTWPPAEPKKPEAVEE